MNIDEPQLPNEIRPEAALQLDKDAGLIILVLIVLGTLAGLGFAKLTILVPVAMVIILWLGARAVSYSQKIVLLDDRFLYVCQLLNWRLEIPFQSIEKVEIHKTDSSEYGSKKPRLETFLRISFKDHAVEHARVAKYLALGSISGLMPYGMVRIGPKYMLIGTPFTEAQLQTASSSLTNRIS